MPHIQLCLEAMSGRRSELTVDTNPALSQQPPIEVSHSSNAVLMPKIATSHPSHCLSQCICGTCANINCMCSQQNATLCTNVQALSEYGLGFTFQQDHQHSRAPLCHDRHQNCGRVCFQAFRFQRIWCSQKQQFDPRPGLRRTKFPEKSLEKIASPCTGMSLAAPVSFQTLPCLLGH